MNIESGPSAIEREVARILAAEHLKKAHDFLREFSALAFDKAVAFNALVMSAGYVGEFALWDRVKADLSYPERMIIASFLTISLTLYIGWTIKGQWMLAQQQLNFSRMIGALDAADSERVQMLSEKFRADGARTRAFAQRFLPLVWGSAVAFGVLAAIIMVIECFSHLAAGR
jgi:hypothetical protein